MTSYERCWAKAVSNCGEGSDESLSKPDRGETRVDISLPQGLCGKHETELSPLDNALNDLMNCAREVERLRVLRAAIARKDWPQVHLTADGARIERCVLKMLMTHVTVQPESVGDWHPPEWLPLVIFGQRALEAGCGLGVVARVGDVVTNSEEVNFVLGQPESTGQRHSALLEIRGGWRLICSWDRPLAALGNLRFTGTTPAAGEDVLHHPRQIKFRHGQRDLGVSLDFDWSGKWTPSKHRSVVALRAKRLP
ncbi:MAG TPA: hypothetical protein VFQ61_02635 [Polyangiaceae bacterium]|nr:hypothetical protein [Polyangiaceae bacterium]